MATRNPKTQVPMSPNGERIVRAARQHFMAHGFRGVTMDDLAVELGMSKKTIYAAFPGKKDLLRAVVLDKLDSAEADLVRITAAPSGGALAELRELLACLQRHSSEIQPAFVRDLTREAPELFHLVETRRAQMIQRYFGRIFTDGQHDKIVRSDIPLELILEILLNAVQGIMNPARLDALGLTPNAGYQAIVSVVLEGVLTAKGRAQ